MKKISTLFKKDPQNMDTVTTEVDPANLWVYSCGMPTIKYDGTAVAIIKGELYKRYDVKKGKSSPPGAIPCQEPDLITGHFPHWSKCLRENHADKYAFEAFDKIENPIDGTYELCGPMVQSNAEHIDSHVLIKHGSDIILDLKDFSYDSIRSWLADDSHDVEGIVFHAADGSGRMCKIRKKDFGFKRNHSINYGRNDDASR